MGATPAVLGIPAIDRELSGCLPPGWLGLLIGGSGSGTALVAKQYAQAERGGEPVLYYTTHEREEDIRAAVAGFGWSFDGVKVVSIADEYFERVLRRDLEVSRLRDRGLTLKELTDQGNAPVRRRSHNLTNRLLTDLAG